MKSITLNSAEFSIIKRLVFKEIGITLNDTKKSMVENRLYKRLKHYRLDDYSKYIKIVQLSKYELTEFLNSISTNETYFFREPAHFSFLEDVARESKHIRIWSAASSIGAEAYSMAMILDTHCKVWEVIATDINTSVINIAKKGLYQITFLEKIPKKYKDKYCLIGRNDYEGKMLVDRRLYKNMQFYENNLMYENVKLGVFDVIFLRNVLIYFSEETKIKVLTNIVKNLRVGGYLVIGLTENFNSEYFKSLEYINNSIYRKVQVC